MSVSRCLSALILCAVLASCVSPGGASHSGKKGAASSMSAGPQALHNVPTRPSTTTATTTASAKKPRPVDDDSPQKWNQMQYGSLLSATYENRAESGDFTHKGIEIACRETPEARVIFDTELLRYSVAWTDGFIHFTNVAFDGRHGDMLSPRGNILWAGRGQQPGVSVDGKFADPRPLPYGPLPRTTGHYKGLFRHGRDVILNYSVGDCDVLDHPASDLIDGKTVFRRELELGSASKSITIVLAEATAASDPALTVNLRGDVKGIEQKFEAGRYIIKIPPHQEIRRVVSSVCRKSDRLDSIKFAQPAFNLRDQCRGGPANWPDVVETVGKLGSGEGPYVVDTLTVPESNPYGSWMRFGGLDFFSDGRAAICTWSGDVWIVSGIDDSLQKLTWKRYAAGLFQTLGLKIVRDEVYVLGRDQITRLRDLNGDGEADQYENFNNDVMAAESFHEFNFDLQTDSKGNFYFAKAGAVSPGGRGWQRITPHNGTMLRVSPDGQKLEVFATGLRAPNGTSVGPHDEITVSDNQGTWTPVCRINMVTQGSFLGVPDLAHKTPVPTDYGNPICWLPYPDVDNSSGGGVWVTSDRWGPFRDRLLHTSYGQCALFLTMFDRVDELWQGAVVKFPDLEFDSGIDRARISPRDGQVYLTGLKGWQTRAARDACFQRVRYTGRIVNMPTSFHVKENGVEIGFSSPIDPATAGDPDSYDVEQWNYIWSKAYGSPEVHVDDAAQKGRQPVKVAEARVSADRRSVLLVMPQLQPVMQIKIATNVDAADGSTMKYEIDGTINRVPNDRTKPRPATAPATAHN